MSGLILLVFFMLGVLTGAAGMVAFTLHLGLRGRKKEALAKATETSGVKKRSVNERMKRVKEITEEQLDLLQMQDHPQKNSLDGRYKNGLNGQVKELEKEKRELLVSIIVDGHDPEITTVDEVGVVTKMKLSKFMVDAGISMEPKAKAQESKTKNQSKFTVYRGGKDDGGSGTTH